MGDGYGRGSQANTHGAPPGMSGHGSYGGANGRDSRGGMRDDRRNMTGSGGMGGGTPRGPHTPGGSHMVDDSNPHSGSKRRGDDRMDRGREKRPRQG